MSKTIRVIIYPKDIVAITGKSYQSAWSLLKKIRLYYHKQPHQVVTVFEFCQYMNIECKDIISFFD